MKSILSIENLVKRFRNTTVLDKINLELAPGSIHGLVGRNGCGKTMLLKCVCGMVPVTEGKIRYRGKEIGREIEMPDHMGVLIEAPGFLEDYDALWNLRFLASLNGKPDTAYLKELIRLVGLDPESRRKVGKYSMGMKQRLGIAQAIMDEPELLLLDEPMNGLDNAGVQEMRELFRRLNEKGTTIVIASHMEEDIRYLCHEVTHMDTGSIISREVIREIGEKEGK